MARNDDSNKVPVTGVIASIAVSQGAWQTAFYASLVAGAVNGFNNITPAPSTTVQDPTAVTQTTQDLSDRVKSFSGYYQQLSNTGRTLDTLQDKVGAGIPADMPDVADMEQARLSMTVTDNFLRREFDDIATKLTLTTELSEKQALEIFYSNQTFSGAYKDTGITRANFVYRDECLASQDTPTPARDAVQTCVSRMERKEIGNFFNHATYATLLGIGLMGMFTVASVVGYAGEMTVRTGKKKKGYQKELGALKNLLNGPKKD